jgi:hypothetical protein
LWKQHSSFLTADVLTDVLAIFLPYGGDSAMTSIVKMDTIFEHFHFQKK